MKQIIDQHRRKFFGVAAGTVAVGLGVIDLARAETDAAEVADIEMPSFGPIKQIDAGVLNVGYAEAGPRTARRSSCCTAGPTTSTASSMSRRCWQRPAIA